MRASHWLILVAVAAVSRPSRGGDPVTVTPAGRIGLAYEAHGDGLLVTRVLPASPAALAGVVVGDRVVAVDGRDVAGMSDPGIIGAVGSTVELQLAGPWAAPTRLVQLERVVIGPTPPAVVGEPMPPVVRALRLALRDDGRRSAVAATRAAVAADFGGWEAERALRSALERLVEDRPRVAVSVLDELARLCESRVDLCLMAGRGLMAIGQEERALSVLERGVAGRPPDLGDPERPTVALDLGGAAEARAALSRLLWADGRRELALSQATSLLATREDPALRADLGMAQSDGGGAWRAARPAMPDLRLDLLDGVPWSLQAQRGRVVLISFWATWCAPCVAELAAIARLSPTLEAQGLSVLALSVDKADERAAVVEFSRKHELPFPVAHAPDLGARFGVEALPTLRLVGRDGSVHYAARGYSPSSFEELTRRITAALAADPSDEPVVGRLRDGDAALALLTVAPDAGLTSVERAPDGLVVVTEGGMPQLWRRDPAGQLVLGAAGEVDRTDGATGIDRVVWFGGPVGWRANGFRVVANDEDGVGRWVIYTDAPLVDAAASGGLLWLATTREVVAVDERGAVVTRAELKARALTAGAAGVWMVDGTRRYLLTSKGVEDRGAAPAGALIGADGLVGNAEVKVLLQARFGPSGAMRTVAARGDGTVLAFGGSGVVVARLELERVPALSAADLDGDGQDELLMLLPDVGLLAATLSLP
jgi:peroxiredoxin